MADTQRTKAAVLALLADNSAGAISPQDMRDSFVSTWQSHGEMYVSSSAATTISLNNTWYQVGGTYTLTSTPAAHHFSMGTNGRLQYDGTETRMFHAGVSFSLTSAANNVTYEFALALDGTPTTSSIQRRKIGTGTDVGTGALHGFLQVPSGSYISFMVRQTSAGTDNPTFVYANVFAVGMIQ